MSNKYVNDLAAGRLPLTDAVKANVYLMHRVEARKKVLEINEQFEKKVKELAKAAKSDSSESDEKSISTTPTESSTSV